MMDYIVFVTCNMMAAAQYILISNDLLCAPLPMHESYPNSGRYALCQILVIHFQSVHPT